MANQVAVLRLLIQAAPAYCSGDWLAQRLQSVERLFGN